MHRYQIRTPEGEWAEQMVQALEAGVWQAVTPHFSSPAGDSDRQRFAEKIHYFMILYTKAYDLCGLSNVCSEPALSVSPEGQAPSNSDHIYHLVAPMDLESFQYRLTVESVESVMHLLSPQQKHTAFSAVSTAVRNVFARYLFENPLCGAADLCAVSKEVNAWDQEPKKE